MFRATTALIPGHPYFRFHIRGEPPDLSAPDTTAVPALRGKAVLGQLPEIGVPGPGYDQFCRDIALHPREPRVLRDEHFCIRDKIDKLILIIRGIPFEFPEFLNLRTGSDKRRVNLQKVRLEPAIGEDRLEHLLVCCNCRIRQVGHYMESDLDPGITQETICLDGIGHGAAPAVEIKDRVVHVLDANLHFGNPEIEHPVDMLFFTPVRARLECDSNAPDIGTLVCRPDRCNRRYCCRRHVPGIHIHRFYAPGDELILVLNGTGSHRSAHYNKLNLLNSVAKCLELTEPGMNLRKGIIIVLTSPFCRRFLAGVISAANQTDGPVRQGRVSICRGGKGTARSSPQPVRLPRGFGLA